jgi:hypothetical protein
MSTTEGAGSWPPGEGYGGPAAEGSVPMPPPPPKTPTPKPVCGVDEMVGAPGSCSSLVIHKSCSPFPFIHEACADSSRYFKPKIAERAVACIRKKSPLQLCDALHVYKCKDDALHTACADPSADGDCATITQGCPSVSFDQCRVYLSGMNAAGRAAMVKCLTSANGCGWGVYSCSEGL